MEIKPSTIMGMLTLMLSFGTAIGTIYGKTQNGIGENKVSISVNKGLIRNNEVKIESMREVIKRVDENLEYIRRGVEK